MQSSRRSKRLWLNLFLLALLTLLTQNCAYGQTDSASPAQIDYRKEWIKALDKAEDLDRKLKAAQEAIEQLENERDTAQKLQAVTKAERESLERTIAAADKAFAVYDKAIAVYEKTIENQAKINEVQAKRIDKLEDKIDRANRRTVWGIIFSAVAGAIIGR